jgi:hypothetical protein
MSRHSRSHSDDLTKSESSETPSKRKSRLHVPKLLTMSRDSTSGSRPSSPAPSLDLAAPSTPVATTAVASSHTDARGVLLGVAAEANLIGEVLFAIDVFRSSVSHRRSFLFCSDCIYAWLEKRFSNDRCCRQIRGVRTAIGLHLATN